VPDDAVNGLHEMAELVNELLVAPRHALGERRLGLRHLPVSHPGGFEQAHRDGVLEVPDGEGEGRALRVVLRVGVGPSFEQQCHNLFLTHFSRRLERRQRRRPGDRFDVNGVI
jgi:hypothetical protein